MNEEINVQTEQEVVAEQASVEVNAQPVDIVTEEPLRGTGEYSANVIDEQSYGIDDEIPVEDPVIEAEESSDGIKEVASLITANQEFIAMSGLISAKNKITELRTVKDQITNKVKAMCPDDKLSLLESRVEVVSLEELQKLDVSKDSDYEKIKAFYEVDGGTFEFAIKFDDPTREREFYKDFIIYVKTSKEEFAKIDIAMEKLNNDCNAIIEENKDILGDTEKVTSISEYYFTYMTKLLENNAVEDKFKEKINKILVKRKEGITLEFLKKEIQAVIDKKGNASSIRFGYQNSFLDTASKVDKIMKTKFAKYNLNLNLPGFVDLEQKVFTGYSKYNNLFMFLLMRYIKHNYENFTPFDIITLTEVLVNLGYYKFSEADRPETSKEFTESVNSVLSLVVNN